MKVTNDIEFGIGVEEAVSGLKHWLNDSKIDMFIGRKEARTLRYRNWNMFPPSLLFYFHFFPHCYWQIDGIFYQRVNLKISEVKSQPILEKRSLYTAFI
jgi:hypothetical protein